MDVDLKDSGERVLFGGYRKAQGVVVLDRESRRQALVQAWGKSGRMVKKGNSKREGTRSNMGDEWER